jgi:hypothetical protein
LVLGTSEHEEKGGKEAAIGSTHTTHSPLFKSSSHAKTASGECFDRFIPLCVLLR